jgi:hypothetical protein
VQSVVQLGALCCVVTGPKIAGRDKMAAAMHMIHDGVPRPRSTLALAEMVQMFC